jgi:hypothetical protein
MTNLNFTKDNWKQVKSYKQWNSFNLDIMAREALDV